MGEPTSTPPIIDPNTVFTLETARAALDLAENTLRREARLGRLRCAKRAGKILILGAWLLEWIESGEVSRKRKRAGANANGAESAN